MAARWAPLLLVAALALRPATGSANDSAGFEATTGIELTKTDAVTMESEDLHIGLDEIRVAYVFRNTTARPVETLVAFPLPDLDLAPGLTASAWGFPVAGEDFLGFRLWVDDQPLAPQLERRAFFQGRDVTQELQETGGWALVPWTAHNGGYDAIVTTLPKAGMDRLRRDGLLKPGDDTDNPQWVLRTRYFWRQTFPPGVPVRVRHAYKPFIGGSRIARRLGAIADATTWGNPIGGEPDGPARYCLDPETRRAVAAAEARDPRPDGIFGMLNIDYILTTARNWSGPIGRFHLTVDKGAPDSIISLCWTGLKKTGPTSFESILSDFRPDHDLHLLFFVRAVR